MLDVKELTIWEAVALRALFHLPQELVSFVDAKGKNFSESVDINTYMYIVTCIFLLGRQDFVAGT